MLSRILVITALWSAAIAHSSLAAPTLSVYPLGLNDSNNWEFAVDVAIDLDLGASSLAVELAFAIDDSELVSVDVNDPAWAYDNTGLNPFTNTETDGLWTDFIGDRAFASFGSTDIFSNENPVRLLTFETLGNGKTTLRYGLAATNTSSGGDIIAQCCVLYTGYTGAVTAMVPEPTSMGIAVLMMATVGCAGTRFCQIA